MDEKFTVIFYDDKERKKIWDKQEVKKGASVKYQGKLPEKPAENGVEYSFVGWDTTGNMAEVTENIELFARYEASPKMSSKEETLLELIEMNTEMGNLNEVMQAGQKVLTMEKATRNLTTEQKIDLVQRVKQNGFVELDKQTENERH